jgi:Methyltransferase domain
LTVPSRCYFLTMSHSAKPSTAQPAVRRLARIAKGLAVPSSRDRYLAEARRRLRGDRANQPALQKGQRCLVCGSRRVWGETVTNAKNPAKACLVHICRSCGYVHIPKADSFYSALSSYEQLHLPAAVNPVGTAVSRAGTYEQPGREFHIAKMAIDILGRDNVEVLVYGAGSSLDNHHIAKLDAVRHVAIGDIMKLRDDVEFIDVNKPALRAFPVVVASEVVEHFRNPRDDFARLFTFVEDDGLLVCGTSIYDGGNLSRDAYIFFTDHTSYYTPQVLRGIANDAGFHIDFRAPLIADGMRKRYVLFSKSQQVMESVACYFGVELYAPSEIARPRRPPAQKSHQAWRPPRPPPST